MTEREKELDIVIMYDSACPQCSWFMKHLRAEVLNGAGIAISLESEQARNFYSNGRLSVDPECAETMIVIIGDQELLYWQALEFCIQRSDFPRWLKLLVSVVPNGLGNLIYRVLRVMRKVTRRGDNSCKL